MLSIYLLDAYPDLGYLIFAILGTALWFVLLRAAVRADRLSNNTTELLNQQRATNWFLIKLCEKNGVSQEDIDNIKSSFNVK